MRKTQPIIIVAISILFLNAQVLSQSRGSADQLQKLILEYDNATVRFDKYNMDRLVSDGFLETTISGSSTTSLSKAQLSTEPNEKLERAHRKVLSRIKPDSSISAFSVQVKAKRAIFTGKLLRKQSLTISKEDLSSDLATEIGPETTFYNTEYFEISGTAISKNGRWMLASLRKTEQKLAEVTWGGRDWRDVLDENMKFGLLKVFLIVEQAK